MQILQCKWKLYKTNGKCFNKKTIYKQKINNSNESTNG